MQLALIREELKKRRAKLLSLCISGSHLYGFASPNSDIDYRGTYLVKSSELLGLHKPKDVFEFKYKREDVVLFELGKQLNLALAGNCNVYEHI